MLVGGAFILLGLGFFPQEPVRRLVESRLRDAFGPGSRLGGLALTPFLLRAEFRDLHLAGPGYELTLPEGRVALAPRALRGELAVHTIELEGPVLRLSPGGEEVDTPDAAGGPILPPLEIDGVRIRDASLYWTDSGGGELAVEGLSADGAIGSGALVVDAARATWRGEGTIELGPARARLETTRHLDATLDSLEVRGLGSKLTARGLVARRGALALGLELGADLDLDAGGVALGFAELAGAVELSGRLEGPVDRLRATLAGRGAARWESWTLDDLSLDLDAQLDPRKLEMRLEGRTLDGRVVGNVRLDGERVTGHLRGEGLNPARLPPEMRPPVEIAGSAIELSWEGPLDGPLHVDLSVRGRGRVEGAGARLVARAAGSVDTLESTVDLEWSAGLQGEASSPIPLELRLDTSGRLRGAWPPEVTGRFSGAVGPPGDTPRMQTALTGTFTARGTEVQAQLETRGLLDLAGGLEIRGDRLEGLSLLTEPVDLGRFRPGVSGQARLRVRASGPLRSPELQALLSVVGLEWDGAALGRLELGAEGTTERADVRASLPALSIGAEGELRSGEEPRLRGQVELQGAPLGPLSALLGTTEPLGGHLTAALGFDLPLDRPREVEATLDVSALEAVYEDRSLRAQPFRAELGDGRLELGDVRIEGPGVSVDLSASAGLGADEPVSLRAWVDADLGVLPLPEGWSAAGNLSGAVGLSGTRLQPSLNGALHAAGVTVRGASSPEIAIDDVELHLGDVGLTLPRFTARVGSGRGSLEGNVPYAAVWPALRGGALRASDRALISATWEDVALGPFEGGLAGELTLDGGLASLEELAGELRLPTRRLVFEGLTLEVQPAMLRLARRPGDHGRPDGALGARRPRGVAAAPTSCRRPSTSGREEGLPWVSCRAS